MYLIYIDEAKIDIGRPYFYIGGVMIPHDRLYEVEEKLSGLQYNFFGTTVLQVGSEFHGEHIFNGKGKYREYRLADRIELLRQIVGVVTDLRLPVRCVKYDVEHGMKVYVWDHSVYNVSMQHALLSFSEVLQKHKTHGLVFADHEKDESHHSIVSFSTLKDNNFSARLFSGSTHNELGLILDGIYYTQSHFSRFIQLADVVMYLVCRYDRERSLTQWHDQQAFDIYKTLKEKTDFEITFLPPEEKSGETDS